MYPAGGIYGKVVVKPKLGFLWGLAVGEAKRYFYVQWLPASDYDALHMEYELHTEKSVPKKPVIALYIAITEKRICAQHPDAVMPGGGWG